MSEYLLAVDGGQTSTKCVLALKDGTILGCGLGGPSDHFHGAGGLDKNRVAIHGAIGAAYRAADLAPGEVDAAVLGLTGVHENGPEIPRAENLVREIVQPTMLQVVPDYVTNLVGASEDDWGVVVVAGGGAIAYGLSRDRQTRAIAGGFGYLLGDEGSAFQIGRQAAMAAIRASDGRGPSTLLQERVCEALGLTDVRQITRTVYAADFSRDRLSSISPLVADAARSGDAVATSIMTAAGKELARMALAVVKQIAVPGDGVPVYPTGGVFDAGTIILKPFHRTIKSGYRNVSIREPTFPPVIGALILARRQCGLGRSPECMQRVRAGLRTQFGGMKKPASGPQN